VRALLATLLALVLAAAVTTSGAAHEGAPGEGYRSTVAGIEPAVPGLLVDVLDDDEMLAVRNWTGKTVVLEGADGEPLFRFTGDEVRQRDGSGWRVVKRGTSHAWHDARVHWAGATPERSGLVTRWSVPGTVGGEPFVVRGFIGYTAPAASAPARATTSPRLVAAAATIGLLALAALALPLVRRKGERARGMSRG
jgi:hypothetical protein